MQITKFVTQYFEQAREDGAKWLWDDYFALNHVRTPSIADLYVNDNHTKNMYVHKWLMFRCLVRIPSIADLYTNDNHIKTCIF